MSEPLAEQHSTEALESPKEHDCQSLTLSEGSTSNDAADISAEKLAEALSSQKSIPASLQKRISKTKICIHNLSGRCTRGERCSFAHSMTELKEPPDLYKTRLCISWGANGSCVKEKLCR